MALPGKWTSYDILLLSSIKGLNFPIIKDIVNSHSSLHDLENSFNTNLFLSKFNQEEMFTGTLALAKEKADEQAEICEKSGYSIISFWGDEYPELLRDIQYPPLLLFVRGNLDRSDAISVSIVGTRKCTHYGKLITEKYASYFAENGIIVTSGLAYGIDTMAHQSTMKAKGKTYAVIASGVDCINPADSEKNAKMIVDSGGAIISEYKCGTQALIPYFPQRNRIISGISRATVIVESGEKGGALITARFAFDQQREVFAVPGNINSLRSEGTNYLIRKNVAQITLMPEDVLSEIGITTSSSSRISQQKLFLSPEDQELFDLIDSEPIHIDELAFKANIETSTVLVKLLDWEFKNVVRQLPGKYYIKNF